MFHSYVIFIYIISVEQSFDNLSWLHVRLTSLFSFIMSKPLKFYYDLMSQPARALYMFLKLNQIPHEQCIVSIGKGECIRVMVNALYEVTM